MRLLIDTQIIIWINNEPDRISDAVLTEIVDGEVYLSFVSAWEYAQKRRRYPQQLPLTFTQLIAKLPHEPLGCELSFGRYAEILPLIHRDPFDRMLIAQAMEHGLTLVTADKHIHRYDLATLW